MLAYHSRATISLGARLSYLMATQASPACPQNDDLPPAAEHLLGDHVQWQEQSKWLNVPLGLVAKLVPLVPAILHQGHFGSKILLLQGPSAEMSLL